MKREEIRKCINEFFQNNSSIVLSKNTANELKRILEEKYENKEYGNKYEIEVEFNEIFAGPPIYGSVRRCDPFEKTKVLDCVEFIIDSNKGVAVRENRRFSLTLNMSNLSKDDLIDIENISYFYSNKLSFDIYTTFMRVKPFDRGVLANKIEDCLTCFTYDIPPYAFYNYAGKFYHTTNRAIGDIGGGKGFGGFVKEQWSIADISDSIISIGEHAFDGCKNLSGVNIKGNVHYIGKHAFSNIPGLIIHVNETSKPDLWDDEWCDSNCEVIWNQE